MRSVDLVKVTMERLKMYVMENPFSEESEEIHFFKVVKPQFTSKLIYYMKLYRLESNRPVGDSRLLKKFLKSELRELQETFIRHRTFYQYYRSGATYLDSKYFLRTGQDIHLMPDPQYLVLDRTFHTTHDYLVSELQANEKLSQLLTADLEKLQGKVQAPAGKPVSGKNALTWTESKAALYELIYAVFSVGAINNGNTEIKEIANFFAEGLNVDVGNIYRAAQELRIRKISRTKFLNKMIKRVEDRWDETDENPRF
ncbi:MAG: tetracycline regulation of excision, RteC [Chitinophagaceae bacterium]|nr:MAG: tetracycline regulation of excision, RteC [Chitinophagaceae bacterium]